MYFKKYQTNDKLTNQLTTSNCKTYGTSNLNI